MPYANPEAQREYMRQWMARRRAEWFADKRCARCGSEEDLRLDHVDPSQKISHRIWSWAKERREAELAKCQVLCEPCHKLKTKENGEYVVGEAHGRARYPTTTALAVKAMVKAGISQAEVGRLLGINRKTIWYIVHERQGVPG